jgi:predicted dehydrogenase
MIKVGICGFGYCGPNLYRNFGANPNFEVVAVSDPLADCRDKARRFNRQIALFADAIELIDSGTCDAIAFATHYRFAVHALRKRLLVDHVFVFHNAVRELKRLVASGALGTVSYYNSLRVNLGLFQPDVNVLWNPVTRFRHHELSVRGSTSPH